MDSSTHPYPDHLPLASVYEREKKYIVSHFKHFFSICEFNIILCEVDLRTWK